MAALTALSNPAACERRDSEASLMHLRDASREFAVPAQRMLLSYVLRHSCSAMKVRASSGQRCELGPGALLACSGPGLVVHRGSALRHAECMAIDLLLPGVQTPGAFIHLDDYYATFVNSPDGCIRVLMGAWEGRRAMLDPLNGFWMLDVDIAPGQELALPVAAPGAICLLTTGSLIVEGRTVEDTSALALASEGGTLRLASDAGASLLLFPQGFV